MIWAMIGLGFMVAMCGLVLWLVHWGDDEERYDRESGCRPNECHWPNCKCKYPPR